MRPLRLELHGFSAYRAPTTIDFANHDLIVFTGPTGAGKSSIIDGIVFALYGSVARYENEKLVAPIINALSTEARVRFDFSVDGTVYRAVRVVRRTKAGASTKEARLECGDAVLASTAQEVTTEIERILGLSFAQFTKTVVLPQGDFARFLTERARTRQQLLRKLLGLDVFVSVGKQARLRARTVAAEAKTYERVLSEGTPVTETKVNQLRKELNDLEKVQENASAVLDALTEAQEQLDTATARREAVDHDIEALGGLTMPAEAKTHAATFTKAKTLAASTGAAHDAATADYETIRSRRDELPTLRLVLFAGAVLVA